MRGLARRDVISRRGRCLRTTPDGLFLVALAATSGCGGRQARADDARSPETVAAPAQVPAVGEGGAFEVGSSTTTTATLTNANDKQGARLNGAEPVAPVSPEHALPASQHPHEPGRGPADIRARIEAYRDEARSCYDRALSPRSAMGSDLVMQWTIDPKGNVTQVSADPQRSQIADPGVVSCIANVIRKIKFAASAAGYETRASFPFHFHTSHAMQPPSDPAR